MQGLAHRIVRAGWESLKSIRQTIRKGRLESQVETAVHGENFFFFREDSGLLLKPFNFLYQVQPDI